MKESLSQALYDVLQTEDNNFLMPYQPSELKVTKGDNCLSTCYQFKVADKHHDKLLTVKVYDKVIDLLSRDGSTTVGCQARAIVGAKRSQSLFNKRLTDARKTGLTRLEVSIHGESLDAQGPW